MGGISEEDSAHSAVTALHRSRVVLERSIVTPTAFAGVRARDCSRVALNHSRFMLRTLDTLDIGTDAHVALRTVYFDKAPELAVQADKRCYSDTIPLYRPSLLCDWCPRWVSACDLENVTRPPHAPPRESGEEGLSDEATGEDDDDEICPYLLPEFESEDSLRAQMVADGGMVGDRHAGPLKRGYLKESLDCYLYYDAALEGTR